MAIGSILVRLELGALLGMSVALPLFEAPKNLLWLAYAVLWVINRTRSAGFGGPWDRWDTLILAWIAAGYASIAFGGMPGEGWHANADVVRYGSVFWLVRRARYGDRVLAALLAALLSGTLVALAWGYHGVSTREHYHLGLHSVGHVNHSAIYLGIVLGAAVSATRVHWASSPPSLRVLAIALVAFLTVSLFVMQSRAALAGTGIAALILLAAHAHWRKVELRRIAIFLLAGLAVVVLVQPNVLNKYSHIGSSERGGLFAYRDSIWSAGIEAWRSSPLFGVGAEGYGRATGLSHGHSLYVNTLVERGLVGLVALGALLLAWACALLRHRPAPGIPALASAWWGASAAAFLVTVLIGLINTTLHHEHGLLAMLLFAGWLSQLRR
jgi:O-antigen ligase